MNYSPLMLRPMREELTSIGATELLTASDVEETLGNAPGTTMVIVNSVCGCAAGGARPGIRLALSHNKTPDLVTTVFAGQDKEATEKAREYFDSYPPSSPSIGLLKDSKLVFMMQRTDIEGCSPEQIATKLTNAFDEHC